MEVQIRQALLSTGYAQLRQIQFRLRNSTVTLTGVVESFYMKQLAQECIKKVIGNHRVANRLEVKSNGKAS